jgi:hypothetical protein
VSTRNPLLRSLTDAKDAGVIITEAERLYELIQTEQPLPKQVVLAGHGHVSLLKKSMLSKFGKTTWLSKGVMAESDLISRLRDVIHAA